MKITGNFEEVVYKKMFIGSYIFYNDKKYMIKDLSYKHQIDSMTITGEYQGMEEKITIKQKDTHEFILFDDKKRAVKKENGLVVVKENNITKFLGKLKFW